MKAAPPRRPECSSLMRREGSLATWQPLLGPAPVPPLPAARCPPA